MSDNNKTNTQPVEQQQQQQQQQQEDQSTSSSGGLTGGITDFVTNLAGEGYRVGKETFDYLVSTTSAVVGSVVGTSEDTTTSEEGGDKPFSVYDESVLKSRSVNFTDVKLTSESKLIDHDAIVKLAPHIPLHMQGWDWKLVYSTAKHGTSSNTFHRLLEKYNGPSFMFIKDTSNHIFGCYASHAWQKTGKEQYYGNGECFLFKYSPEFKVFKWTRNNDFFQMGLNRKDSVIMGGGDGKFGLYLDESMLNGSSAPCETFDNEVLSSSESFSTTDIEVWGFVLPRNWSARQ